MAEDKYNLKNPAVKRILQEVKEMHSNPSDDFMSLPLEENIFEWQFAIRGPQDTEFEGGIYHGRIQLPAEYPFKPPSFMLLTPNGRFETQTKICLSISNHHPEHWQPSWSVRTALVALIAFLPTNPNGALGSLDYPKEERRSLAIKSREAGPKFGSSERQRLIDEIHEYMLSRAPGVPQENTTKVSEVPNDNKECGSQGSARSSSPEIVEEVLPNPAVDDGTVGELNETSSNGNAVQTSEPVSVMYATEQQLVHKPEAGHSKRADDRFFTYAAVGLTMAIIVLLLKKFMKANGYGTFFMDES
ncbi:ubiquitin-conjugating enzyme E2 32-like [Olea europaea var. sylvestris]|uniref:Ubiquitin-conjugating enzyme E2 32 n=1 Tax=Olea europaea subsp. europaea TaxID=158383 RepID=A0A8S0U0V2_OLEEU|nr:ubiquitin-conjugating enzyme E2 32-like [Olea europaea var. sylvestris]CAA3012115.1 ubiquitin-conjugating enzyme E2 32 [Olea europaea subsp. europaea]